MSGQENVEGQAPKSDLEAFRGLIEYMSSSPWWSHNMADMLPLDFALSFALNKELRDVDKLDAALSLGEVKGFIELVWSAYELGLSGGFFDNKDNVKRFMALASELMTVYLNYKAGQLNDGEKLIMAVNHLIGEFKSFLLDFLEYLQDKT